MRFLVGADGSDRSIQAIAVTVDRAKTSDEITVAVYATGNDIDEVEAHVRDELERISRSVDIVRLSDAPGGKLVELAEREKFDRIVLSGGKRSPLGKIQLDSVAEFVLLNARSSVTLIR